MNTAEIRKRANASIKGKYFKTIMISLIYMLFTFICCLVPIIGLIFIMVMSIPLSYGIYCSIIKLKRNENVGYFDFISIAFSEFGNAWKVTFSMLGKVWPYLLGYIGSFIFILIGSIITFISMSSSTIIDSSSSTSLAGFIPLIIICVIGGIAGIVFYVLLLLKLLYYSLSFNVLYDNKELKGKEIVEKSYDLMNGHRWDLVKMQIPYYLIDFGITFLIAIVLSVLSIIFKAEILTSLANLINQIPMIFIMPFIQFAIIQFYDTLTNNEFDENPISEIYNNTSSNSKKGFSITALVLGIISLLTCCIMPLSILCSILAIIFGIIGLFRGGKGLGIAGLITGFLGIILSVIMIMVIGIGSLNSPIIDKSQNAIDSYEIKEQKEEELLNEIEKKFNDILENKTNTNSTTNNTSSSSDRKLTVKDTNVKFNIPADYKVSNSYNYSSSASRYFNNKDYSISVTCKLDSYNPETAEEYLNSQVKYDEDNKNYTNSGIKTVTINNKKINYMIWQYDLSYSSVQKIAAIYILPNDYCYIVTASTYDDDTTLNLNTIKDFITIE